MTDKIDTSPEAVAAIMARERHRPFPYSLDGLETATLIDALSAERARLETAHAQMQQTLDRVTDERDAALVACRIIDAAALEGHPNQMDLIMHFLSALEPARAALLLATTPATDANDG